MKKGCRIITLIALIALTLNVQANPYVHIID